MDAFVNNISSFPTAIFTFLNIFVCGFWLLSIFGFLDLDSLELDIELDDSGDPQGLASVLSFLGLTGVPITIIATVVVVTSFIFSYYAVYFGLFLGAQIWLMVLTGCGIAVGSFVLSLPVSAIAIKPLRRLFARFDAELDSKMFIGATCTIRTSTVDSKHGEAECTINGASLIIKVRADNAGLKHGDKAVIIEHDTDANIYHIVSQAQFAL
ncbi:MAG: hypothetical protein MJK04_21165 [Psychrosphaera sp.]|nr:hypothetical protein [Psychrosphaera sp.]